MQSKCQETIKTNISTLPIDSKFPLEDYYRLEDAYESGNKEEIENHRKSL